MSRCWNDSPLSMRRITVSSQASLEAGGVSDSVQMDLLRENQTETVIVDEDHVAVEDSLPRPSEWHHVSCKSSQNCR